MRDETIPSTNIPMCLIARCADEYMMGYWLWIMDWIVIDLNMNRMFR